MPRTNIASGNDRVAVQVGRVVPGDTSQEPEHDVEVNPAGQPAGLVVNVLEGGATVGVQANTIEGGLTVIM